MKHLIAGIVLLAVLLALGLGAVGWMERCASQAVQELRMAEVAVNEENYPNVRICVRQAQELWLRGERWFHVLIPLRQIDEIDRAFARLLVAAGEEDQTEFRINCAELIYLLEHVAQSEQIRIESVL